VIADRESTADLAEPEIRDRIRAFVRGSLPNDDGHPIDDDAPLLRGSLDSLGLMELLTFIEDEFGLAIDPDDIDEQHFGSIRRVATLVAARTRHA
jgi:acyl carrier protein